MLLKVLQFKNVLNVSLDYTYMEQLLVIVIHVLAIVKPANMMLMQELNVFHAKKARPILWWLRMLILRVNA
jgi:hypothetical protein